MFSGVELDVRVWDIFTNQLMAYTKEIAPSVVILTHAWCRQSSCTFCHYKFHIYHVLVFYFILSHVTLHACGHWEAQSFKCLEWIEIASQL